MKKEFSVYEKIRGHFLLARLNVGGIFARSVVWIFRFSAEEGAAGLILNRPTGKSLETCLPEFAGTPQGSVPVFEGGPVDGERLCFLLRSRDALSGNSTVRLGATAEEIRGAIYSPGARAYAFIGRAEWAPGQLEDEIARGTWMRARMDEKAWDAGGSADFWRRLAAKIRKPEAELMLFAPEHLEEN